MKKIAMLLTACIFAAFLTGCAPNTVDSNAEEDVSSRFIIVESTGYWYVVADKETKVMYAVSYDNRNCGNFTLLVDENGDPLLYEENSDEQTTDD